MGQYILHPLAYKDALLQKDDGRAILKPKDKATKKDTITKVTGGGEFQKVVQI